MLFVCVEALEEQFRSQAVGLVTADEFREARKKLEELKDAEEYVFVMIK